jgi:hypothetical protein
VFPGPGTKASRGHVRGSRRKLGVSSRFTLLDVSSGLAPGHALFGHAWKLTQAANGRQGAAAAETAQVGAQGYPASAVGNPTTSYGVESCVRFHSARPRFLW